MDFMAMWDKAREVDTSETGTNALLLAGKCGLSIQSKSAAGALNNLNFLGRPAFCADVSGSKTIVFDERHKHVNFLVMHEIAHTALKHQKDNEKQEFEANMLACMILCPPDRTSKQAEKFAQEHAVPVEIAEQYIKYINENMQEPEPAEAPKPKRSLYIQLGIYAACAVAALVYAIFFT